MMLGKLQSGQYYLCIITGIAFIYAVVNKILPPEAISGIITLVFVSYFRRDRKGEEK